MSKIYRKQVRKAGLPPGTLIFDGERKVEKTRINIFDYDECAYGVPCQAQPVPQPNNSTRTINRVQDQFLHTLRIDTTYRTSIPFTDTTVQATPSFGMFYDWQGMFVFQPGVRFVRDPWRFIVDYTNVNSGVFRTTFGAVRDRDNLRFQIEYVL